MASFKVEIHEPRLNKWLTPTSKYFKQLTKAEEYEKRLLRQANAKLKSRIRKVGKKKKCNSDMFLTGFNMVLFIVGFINTFAMLL